MSPSLNRSQSEAAATPGHQGVVTAPDPELLTVSEELGAIFTKAFAGAATATQATRARPSRPSGRPVFSGPGRPPGRRGLIAAGVGAGLLGLCLGALMEKSALLSRPQTRDGAEIAAVALAPTPLPPTPLPPTPLPPTSSLPSPLSTPPLSTPPLSTPPLSTPSLPPVQDMAQPEHLASPDLSPPRRSPSMALASGASPSAFASPRSVAAAQSTAALASPADRRAPPISGATPPPAVGPAHKPLRLAMLAAAPLRTASSPLDTPRSPSIAAPPATAGAYAVAPPAARLSSPAQAASRPAPWRGIERCDWPRICGPSPAVLQADSRLRQAYSAAARAGVNPHLLEAFRQNWVEMRYALGNQPPQLLNGYRQLTESLWQARRSRLSRQDEEPGYDGSERDDGGPPE